MDSNTMISFQRTSVTLAGLTLVRNEPSASLSVSAGVPAEKVTVVTVPCCAPLPLPLKSALRNHNAARVSSSGGLAGLRTPCTGKTLTRVLFLAAALALLFLGKADSGEAANITVN